MSIYLLFAILSTNSAAIFLSINFFAYESYTLFYLSMATLIVILNGQGRPIVELADAAHIGSRVWAPFQYTNILPPTAFV